MFFYDPRGYRIERDDSFAVCKCGGEHFKLVCTDSYTYQCSSCKRLWQEECLLFEPYDEDDDTHGPLANQ